MRERVVLTWAAAREGFLEERALRWAACGANRAACPPRASRTLLLLCSGEPGKALSRGITCVLNKLLLKRVQVMALGSPEREETPE